MAEDGSNSGDVTKYSILVGFLLIIVFVVPCVAFALLSKYFQKQPLKRKATLDDRHINRTRSGSRGSLNFAIGERTTSEAGLQKDYSNDSVDYGVFGQFDFPVDKIECLMKCSVGGALACCETWKAYTPPIISKNDKKNKKLIIIRKLSSASKEGSSKNQHVKCLKGEMSLLSHLPSHPNILNLLGVCMAGGVPAALLLEYPPYGSLHSFLICKAKAAASDNSGFWPELRKKVPAHQLVLSLAEPSVHELLNDPDIRSRPFTAPLNGPFTEVDELIFAMQIASGMKHLELNNVLHKRLSTENIQISSGFHLKLVGMEVPVLHHSMSVLQRTPSGRTLFKWESPEFMECGDYSNKSEVWRFGMTLWEIASLGDTPFSDVSNRLLTDLLKRGERPPNPPGTTENLYKLMLECWGEQPEDRPTFTQILEMIQDQLISAQNTRKRRHSSPAPRPIQVLTYTDSPQYSRPPAEMDLLMQRTRSLTAGSSDSTTLLISSGSLDIPNQEVNKDYMETDV